MSTVICDITMSLDGYVAGPYPSLQEPLGRGGEELHEWAFELAAWREPHGREGGVESPAGDRLRERVARTGAVVMGRRMFSGGSGPWKDDPMASGWWGDEPPFGVPVFVVTHHGRDPLALGATTFHFVTDGPAAALELAREAAGERDVHVAGGADVIRRLLALDAIDELEVHVAPVFLGGGTRLFDGDYGPARVLAGETAHVIGSRKS